MAEHGPDKRRTRTARSLPHAVRSEPRALKLAQLELLVLAGPDRGRRFHLESPRVTVGFAEANSVRLSDESVSDRHAQLEDTAGGVRLKDLGSTNGTKVDGVPVVEAFLKPGCDITLGDTVVRFQPRPDQ